MRSLFRHRDFAGPALATALVLGLGPGYAFALDAATFLVSAAFLIRLRPRERGEPAVRTTVLAELREGWTEVLAVGSGLALLALALTFTSRELRHLAAAEAAASR